MNRFDLFEFYAFQRKLHVLKSTTMLTAPAPIDRAEPAAEASRWLTASRQLDLEHPKVRITALKLTQRHQTLAHRAMALHDHVRSLPFAAHADSASITASEVLRRGSGDCHSKALLFTALCRAAGLPARMLFLEVRTRFLAGLLDEAPRAMIHAVSQVLLGDRWLSTDAYVLDPLLFAQARLQVLDSGLDCGWGLVSDARARWDGQRDCLHQFRAEDIRQVAGIFDDPADLYAARAASGTGLRHRLAYALGVSLLNRRVAELRRLPPQPLPARPPVSIL